MTSGPEIATADAMMTEQVQQKYGDVGLASLNHSPDHPPYVSFFCRMPL